MYELDLMNQWGGQTDQQGWDQQGWDQWDDGSHGGPYLRSLGCLTVAPTSSACASSCPCGTSRPPVSTSNRFDVFDDSIQVPIEQLIKESTRKPRKRKVVSRIGTPAGPSGRADGGIAQAASLVSFPHGAKPEVFPALPGSGEPTAWTCLRAIQNYEKHMYKSLGVELNDTDIEVIRRSSLGIEGWALSKFGEANDIDMFPKLPRAPLEGSGLAPPPADGHRAADSDTFIKAIRDNELITDPSAPLVGGGHAPLVAVGHRAGDESPPGGAAAASMESGEMRNNPDQVVGCRATCQVDRTNMLSMFRQPHHPQSL